MPDLAEGFAVEAVNCPSIWMCHRHDFGTLMRTEIMARQRV
jgi:hypothetical protein